MNWSLINRKLFLLIVFCIPFQVGYHFWPSFSFVNGVRIDYLSPTLYLLDILVIAWIGICLFKNGLQLQIQSKSFNFILLLFVASVVLNIFFSKSLGAHIFGIVKLVEFFLFGYFVSRTFKKQDLIPFVRTISISAAITSVLAIWQLINQSSVGGLFYFLGERTFNLSTIGISTVNLDHQILRAYGAFPHPNVLAFFLLIAIVFILTKFKDESSLWKLIFSVCLVLCAIALLATFSRITIFLAVIFVAYRFFNKIGAIIAILLLFFTTLFLGSQFALRGIDLRNELLSQSFTVFSQSPYFGIGLNNFFIHQAPLIKTISPTNFQPPHNIFVLSLLSLGLIGWWIVPAVFFHSIKHLVESRIKNHKSRDYKNALIFLVCSIIAVGMVDHFFLTVEQGQIMLALILGLVLI